MGKRILIALFGLVVVGGIAAGIFIYVSREPAPAPTPVIEPTPTPTKSPRSLLRAGEQTTELRAVGGYGGDGIASRLIEPGRFVASVTANIPEPPPGKFYEAYLVRPSPQAFFSLGKLQRKDEEYIVTLEQARDASPYVEIWVTLETKDDRQPETHVLEGAFGR